MTTRQHPLRSGFNYMTTALEVVDGIDLSGKQAIVTGGASGLGLEAARALAKAGAAVVVAVRDVDRATPAIEGLLNVEAAMLDLAEPKSIDAFAAQFLSTDRPLHILINNAGVMASPLSRDGRGYESQFATNHLGHFQLAARLWPALQRAQGARVVAVSSRGHRFSPMNFEDPNFDSRPYDRWVAYGQSKTANALSAVGIDARGAADRIRAFSLHPGRIVDTGLARHMSAAEVKAIPVADARGRAFTDPADFIKTPEQGAATQVWCATSPKLEGLGGLYCEDCDIASLVPPESQGLGVRPYAVDPELAERLMQLSEALTGASIPSRES
ncbi:MAG: oxidoreductase [Steroidobacteraceae bacterium]|jgi:NAD(P)-dependent dehydrogenase (short-subunit alcohol dehydrogenase family)